jgi:hypothetical protein
MRRKLVLGMCLAAALGTVSCQQDQNEPTAPANSVELSRKTAHPKVDRNHIKLPARARKIDQQFSKIARRVIDPNDFECPPSTPLIDYLIGTINESIQKEPDVFNTLIGLAADVIPTVDAILFETESTPQSQIFGFSGEYNHRMTKIERDTKRFWDINSAGIQLVAMKGTMLLDVNRVARTYEAAFVNDDGTPISHSLALVLANIVRTTLLQSVTMDRGNYPLFSFNAFAVSGGGPGFPAKIVMGDGVLESYKAIGFNDVAPQAVYAHEFGHHIQFQRGYFGDPLATTGSEAERTRYTELMADAFSAYYLTHKRGSALNKHRVAQFLQVFFDIGDCAFDNPGHHGTPNQRMRAANFGFTVADRAQKQGHILTADQFHALFVAAYPSLVAPDAT